MSTDDRTDGGAGSEPSRSSKDLPTDLPGLEAEFFSLCGAWDAGADEQTSYPTATRAVLQAVKEAPILSTRDATIKVGVLLEQRCWLLGGTEYVFDILRQVLEYLQGLGEER